MKTVLRVEGEITEDGHLLVELPPELPHGRVAVTLEPLDEDDLELAEEDLTGAGLTAEEIALSPEIGAWAEDDEAHQPQASPGSGREETLLTRG
jgi:hypothetical protein